MTRFVGTFRPWMLLLGLCLAVPAAARDYRQYLVGDRALPTPGPVAPGLLLMGGGDRNYDALRWFLAKAGHGHVVVLRASQGNEMAEAFYRDVGGVASVETFVFKGRGASSDPALLRSLARADGIFIAGGDQSRYVRYWKDTPVAAALDAHVRAGKPLGGTSAGLAMLGEYVYGAMDGGSLTSAPALADPLGPATTLETGFLHLDLLKRVVTDTHFNERDRLGRLFAFRAKAATLAPAGQPLIGLGVDESAALAVERDGSARIYATDPQAGATVVAGPLQPATPAGQPLQAARIETVGVGPGSTLYLPEGRVESPSFHRYYAVDGGRMREIPTTTLVIHGGAGVERASTSAADQAQARAAMQAALRAGQALLAQGKPAVDAVAAAIAVLEDSPQFNAGKGAVFTHDGRNELDAAIMDGASGKAGAVAGVRRVKNPILLARAVMERSEHVMMVGDGAEAFARRHGVTLVDPSYFRTDKRWKQLQRALQEEAGKQAHADLETARHFGTVGALALDMQGRLAAGTSTGGMTNKRYGRVGDSPIIGAGTYADSRCAVSGTGWGEYYIRAVAAYDICARVKYAGQSLAQAAEAVIDQQIPKAGGDGGAIALGADGSVAFPFNTEGMYRGWIGADGVPHVAIFKDEALPLPGAL
ncbi:isoaspartyl peptidase/L-asparaginase [Xanthomonas sp. AmX2]|nr:isoaspartyl peptidase/L-asparaginase [Xanthomonas sp.]